MADPSPTELVRRILAAFNERDLATLQSFVHDDFELWPYISSVSGAVYHGRSGIARYLADLDETWTGFQIDLDVLDVEELGPHHALATARITSRGRESGVSADQTVFQLYRFRDGLGAAIHSFGDRDAALEFAAADDA